MQWKQDKACLEVGDFIPISELANVLELSSNEEADKMYDEIYKNINKRQQNDLDLKDFFEKYI